MHARDDYAVSGENKILIGPQSIVLYSAEITVALSPLLMVLGFARV